MAIIIFPLVYVFTLLLAPLQVQSASCRCFPGDSCWPTVKEWSAFNTSVGGKLIATVPLAAPCHNSKWSKYDATACEALKAQWFFPRTHIASSSSVMSPISTNNSCNPFASPDTPCTLGNYVSYAVNAATIGDYQKTLRFAQDHDIRLVIRNTGHDYQGRSTGAGALALWTHQIKTLEAKDYSCPQYKGKAIKIGAGIEVAEAYKFADSKGLLVVGGNCPTVGVAGGYTQGGGHGLLASKYGLAADQVLEWEVVLANGKQVTATPNQYSDLYWALSGGGAGNYGAVYSVTVKAYPTPFVAGGNLTVPFTQATSKGFWDAVATFHQSLPALTAAGVSLIWTVSAEYFAIVPASAPGLKAAALDKLLQPTLDKLKASQIPYEYHSADYKTWLEAYQQISPTENVAYYQLGGRFIPKTVVQDNKKNLELNSAIQATIRNGGTFVGVGLDVSKKEAFKGAASANPAWRNAIISVTVGLPYDYANEPGNIKALNDIPNVLLPPYEKLSPGGGAYGNEGATLQKNFQQVFFGQNYGRLRDIKAKYDPQDDFYALLGVGSDEWVQRPDGRLCEA
jgi:hypothetical protein